MMEEERKEYLKNYRKEHIKRISLDLDMVRYNRLMTHIGTTGESANGFIKRAIEHQIRDDVFNTPDVRAGYEQNRDDLYMLKDLIVRVLSLADREDDADK